MDLERLLATVGDARPRGATVRDYRFFASEIRRLSLGVKDTHVGSAHAPVAVTASGGVRYLLVWDDGRVSRGYLERTQVEDHPARALEDARSAAYDDPDAAQVLGPAELPEVELHDEDTARFARGETALLGERLGEIRRRAAAPGIRTWSGSFSFAESEDRLVTSAGFDAGSLPTAAGWHVTLNGEVGSGFRARRPESRGAFEARLDRLVELARELDRPAGPSSGGLRRVILHPRVVEEYALGTLLANLSGETVAHGEGRFRPRDFASAERVFREDVCLRIDPLRPLRAGSYRFTREGVPARPCTFIEHGRLVQPVLDLKYARRLGLAPTPLPAASDGIFFEGPPSLRLEEALPRAAGGALVLSVLGVHTQDPASGDFSLGVPQALRIGPNGYSGKLRATISGNLFEVLRSETLALVIFEGEHTPGWLIDCRLEPS